ncbi:MAG: hypothetical protein ACNI27_01355 [Desulfovibrio sp.]
MSEKANEVRKTFPMSTFVSFITGEGKEAQAQNINDLLAYVTGAAIDGENEMFAAALAKSWVYEQHPELVTMKAAEIAEKGDNVSVAPLADAEAVEAIFAKLADYKATVAAQATAVADLEKKYAEAAAKLEQTEKDLAEYKGKCEAFEASAKGSGDEVIVASKAIVDDYVGQVAELVKQIEDIKNGVATMAVAAPAAGAAAASAGADAAPESSAGDDFGFTGGGDDPFASTDW